MSTRRGTRLAAVVLVLALALPTVAIAQSLDEVAQRKDLLEQEIARVTADIEALVVRRAQTEDQLATLQHQAGQLEEQAVDAERALEVRARAGFMRGEASTLETLLTSDPTAAAQRAHFLAALSRRDLASLQSAVALRRQVAQNRALLAARSQELALLETQLQQRGADLEQRFSDVTAVYQELKSRKDRQRLIARGAQQGIYACILSGAYHFANSWGAPRSGGRRHKGTDVMGPHGANVYAFTNGRVQRFSSGGLGGIGLYLWGDDGVQYYYAHLQGYAPGVYPGTRVEAGQLIAYNGNSGNARGGAAHVHFEVHPGGGGPVNPYHWLTPVC